MKYTVVSVTYGPMHTYDNEKDATDSMNSYNWATDNDKAYIEKEEETMKTTATKPNQFTFEGSTYYTNDKGTYFYCIKAGNTKADRIPKMIYDEAKELYDVEQEVENLELHPTDEEVEAAQAELDKEPCFVDPVADLYTPAVIDENGCVDCRECNVKECVHRNCMRRNPKNVGGLGECPRLNVKVEEPDEAQDPELERIMDETGLEPADAELERNIRNEQKKPARKPRKSKDIAYEGHGKTLTAKQVDFILHLSDSCFWEHGLESALWIDCLCDEIEGQFAGKPMTVGAMVSTLCEKGLGYRATDSMTDMTTGRSRKATYFALTDLGKEIAKELGLE